MGRENRLIPASELMAYTSKIKPPAPRNEKTDEQIAEEQATAEMVKTAPRTLAGLVEIAASKGISREEMGEVLRKAGFNGFKVENWDAMKEALNGVDNPIE